MGLCFDNIFNWDESAFGLSHLNSMRFFKRLNACWRDCEDGTLIIILLKEFRWMEGDGETMPAASKVTGADINFARIEESSSKDDIMWDGVIIIHKSFDCFDSATEGEFREDDIMEKDKACASQGTCSGFELGSRIREDICRGWNL